MCVFLLHNPCLSRRMPEMLGIGLEGRLAPVDRFCSCRGEPWVPLREQCVLLAHVLSQVQVDSSSQRDHPPAPAFCG